MPSFRILAIDHAVFRVADLDRARAFYCAVIGCHEEKWQPDLGLLQLRAGDALIDLVDIAGKLGSAGGAAPGAEGRNVDHLALRIAPFDEPALRAHLAAHGVTVIAAGQRYGAQGIGPSLYINDPDGNTIELKGPPA